MTGETVWFKQTHLFNVTNLPEGVREALLEMSDEDRLPRNIFSATARSSILRCSTKSARSIATRCCRFHGKPPIRSRSTT